MDERRSFANGNGNVSFQGPQPVRVDQSVADAKAGSTTFWDLI